MPGWPSSPAPITGLYRNPKLSVCLSPLLYYRRYWTMYPAGGAGITLELKIEKNLAQRVFSCQDVRCVWATNAEARSPCHRQSDDKGDLDQCRDMWLHYEAHLSVLLTTFVISYFLNSLFILSTINVEIQDSFSQENISVICVQICLFTLLPSVLLPFLPQSGLTNHTSAGTCEQLSYHHIMYCDREKSHKFSTKRFQLE